MTNADEKYFTSALPDSPDFAYRYFCKLFDDMIVRDLCLRRRRELSGRSHFSCTGCSKDRILTSLGKRRITFYHQG